MTSQVAYDWVLNEQIAIFQGNKTVEDIVAVHLQDGTITSYASRQAMEPHMERWGLFPPPFESGLACDCFDQRKRQK